MKTLWKNGFSIFLTVYGLAYLTWRATYTVNPEIPFLSWACIAAEAVYFLGTLLFVLDTWDTGRKRKFAMPEKTARVDVFIPTYDESDEILRATVVGCDSLTYPHRTFLLDDGRRPSVQQLAERYRCGYLTRENNSHAKAGNLNAALPKTDGEFVVILDADMIPQPGMIEKAIGYFADPKVAVVQFPQEFYNLTSVQHDRRTGTWHEQSLFFHVLLPNRDTNNGAFWCGSPAVIRRSAIAAVGGVATESVTEDFLTSVKLNDAGWSIVYSNENVAYGIAPETLQAFFIQRFRWCKGALEVFLSHHNPFLKKGLTWLQKLFYLSSQFHYVTIVPKTFYLTLPIWLLLYEEFPIRAPFTAFISFWLPLYVMSVAQMRFKAGPHFRFFQSEVFNLLGLFNALHALTVGFILRKGRKFRVTPKGVDRDTAKTRDRKLLVPHLVMALALIANVYLLVVPLWEEPELWASEETPFRLFGLGWVLFHLVLSVRAISWVTQRNYSSRNYRFPATLPAEFRDGPEVWQAETVDLNSEGAKVRGKGKMPPAEAKLEVFFPEGSFVSDTVFHWRRQGPDSWEAGLTFHSYRDDSMNGLIRFLYLDLPNHWSTFQHRYKYQRPAEVRPAEISRAS